MGTEWASIKQGCKEIDELPLDDGIKADLFQRIYTYIRVAGSFLQVYGEKSKEIEMLAEYTEAKEEKSENSHS